MPRVADVWPDFPPHLVNPGQEDWARTAFQVPPAAVALKTPNALGLYDMVGNCAERVADTCATNRFHWGRTEWGVTTTGLYAGQGLAIADPVERSGGQPLMVGSPLAPDLEGDRAWSADFDRLPHLGFRLCLGPRLEQPAKTHGGIGDAALPTANLGHAGRTTLPYGRGASPMRPQGIVRSF